MLGEGDTRMVQAADAGLSAFVPLWRVKVVASACFVVALSRVKGAPASLELIIQAAS